jgi:hypothetical protein
MHPERVVAARVSAVVAITTVVAAAVGAFGVFSSGTSSQM